MKTVRFPKQEQWADLVRRPFEDDSEVRQSVCAVLKDIKELGNVAVRCYAEKFDSFSGNSFEISPEERQEGAQQCPVDLQNAMQIAVRNVETFHACQRELQQEEVCPMEGVTCWRRPEPMQRVGFYIPSGTAPLFSTLLMLGVPARLAGCPERVLCTPPWKNNLIHPAILYAAELVGVQRIFKVGGAQAIAAMAYGTETIPAVDKIFGPGNRFVTAAKQLVAQEVVAIDMPAGPSEVAIIADHTAFPQFVAADLLSQAEHGVDSHVVFVTTSEELLQAVHVQLEQQCASLPRREIARQALEKSCAILVEDLRQAMDLVNLYAPEHLILAVGKPRELAEEVRNAGSVFLGHYTPEALGDYASGTNHVLPTNGWARAYSGVSVASFQKQITFQEVTPLGIKNLGPVVETMAAHEELHAHKEAVSIRLRELSHGMK
jgi:histidinol dehydrogenase